MNQYSDLALQLWVAQREGIIKSNAQFWKTFPTRQTFEAFVAENEGFKRAVEVFKVRLEYEAEENPMDFGIISVYDENFPQVNDRIKNNSEKPYLLFYRGNISLLNQLENNVAVIGLLNPTEEIEARERKMVKVLVDQNLNIVSGLAKGCDAIAHQAALDYGGKTIAILPSTLHRIFPAENRKLAAEIVEAGGLLITEYNEEPKSKYAGISRFIERDRLQALFSKTVILTASYREGEGDSGSRHAMEAAGKYGIGRLIMFNDQTDAREPKFGLNVDYAQKGIRQVTAGALKELA